MGRLNRDVDNLEETPSVADQASHAHDGILMKRKSGKDSALQAGFHRLPGKSAQSSYFTQTHIFFGSGDLGAD